MELLTNSSLTTFKICPRRYQLQYEMGYVPVRDSEALYFGRAFHEALEAWHGAGKSIEAVGPVVMKLHTKQDDPYFYVKIMALVEGYHERYKDEPFKTIMVEKEFRAPLLNPETACASRTFDLGGKMDRIVQDANGRNVLMETKTTGEDISDPEADYWRKLLIDSQISQYYVGAEAVGLPIETCIYDVTRKPTIRPSQVGKAVDPVNPKRVETPEEYYARLKADIAERPNFYYARREVARMKSDLETFFYDVWNIALAIRAFEVRGKDFPRYTNSCTGLRGRCAYFDVCTGQASLEDKSLFEKVENKHRELSAA